MAEKLFMTLIEAHNAHQRRGRQAFRRLGLTTGQPRTLYLLQQKDGVTQKELAKLCGIEPPSMTALLYRMEEKNLIWREKTLVSGGKRAFLVHLTEQGRQMAESVEQQVERMEEICLEGFSPEQRRDLLEALKRVTENLNKGADGEE